MHICPADASARTARPAVRIGCTVSLAERSTTSVQTTRNFHGSDSGRVIPDPIPNSVVKPSNVDGTAKVTWGEMRTLPGS